MNAFRLATAAGLALAASAHAQFSTNPSINLPIADRTAEQIQPKIATLPDGSHYIAWFDNATGGYDVYLQRIDRRGYELWPHNGILLANRAVSSTTDYDLDIDANGNAIIAFNDDGGVSGGTQQIVVHAVSPGGQRYFGNAGLTVSSGTAFKASAKVAILGNSTFAVGWTGSNSVNFVTVQASFPVLPPINVSPVVTVPNPGGLYQSLSDLAPSIDGDVIPMWVQGTTTSPITSTRTLRAERYDPQTSSWLWNAGTGVPVGVSTSLQNANFPRALGDPQGGITVAWYEIGGSRGAFLQRLGPTGTPQFPTPLSAPLGVGRIALGAELGVCCSGEPSWSSVHLIVPTSAASPQGSYGVSAARWFDLGGPLPGSVAADVLPPGSTTNPPRITGFSAPDPAGVDILFSVGDSAIGSPVNLINAYRLDPLTLALNGAVIPLSTAPGGKSRTVAARSATQAVFAFESGTPFDILAQNVNPDGSLGFCYANCDFSSVVPALNALDFACYLSEYRSGSPYANCDGSTIVPTLNALDFACFLARFQQGCN